MPTHKLHLQLENEGFALIGESAKQTLCQDCNRPRFLISGRCEPCTNEHNQALIRSEAMQGTFFGEEAQ